ncbi:MAG: lactate dehydrogenase [Deltaproteobacteria bacterium]|nr:MAG: lactate dehydrogenase [Deltaproteobacteria bacterium]
MKIMFAAPENAWGGFLSLLQAEIPEHQCEATGEFRVASLKDVDVLIPTMCRITSDMLAQSRRLRLIQQCGSGLEGVDIKAARLKSIRVANVPTDISGNADSVAELGIYFIIGLSRHVRRLEISLQQCRMGEPQGRALNGQTIGIIGLGGIGRALIKRLHPFGVRLLGLKQHHPEKARSELGLDWVGGPDDLKTLLENSDHVVLCLPVTTESENMINAEAFGMMKKNAFLINLSRGGLVNRDALKNALADGQIAGAGLDVFWEEPPEPDDPVFHYNVMATPHIGGSTDVSMKGIVRVVAENIRRISSGRLPLYLQ